MSTGVSVDDSCIAKFNDIKLSKLKARYVTYKIADGQIVEDQISMDGSFDDFLATIPEDDCRYALYDMAFTTNDGRPTSKLVLITWAPDTAKVKSKMLYAGSKESLNRAFTGVGIKINATDLSELTEEVVTDACKKFA
jgi:cofilin